ncbi:uncharacterized protein LOC119669580 [Teleopsis dalmanni]|uniref:uncharacterized protein LOC119669580 n=1 Tax=Teleopsis dalmanni TaxID=139649 RepID=UPI0018CF7BF9|nr:uncharacterized protein LOC119669580 [Teleopsis dalmanni]XP_037935456.1 uncharacterized protein LOC119669580 [Teleopsis dalmanni]
MTETQMIAKSRGIRSEKYIIFNANFFVRTLRGGFYIPAEVCLIEFSIDEGITNIYHTLIKPCISLHGEQYNAKIHSDETHRLPIPPYAIGEKNIAKVYNEIIEFTKEKETNTYRPVYTIQEGMKIAQNIVNFMKLDLGTNDIKLDIRPLEVLLEHMKNASISVNAATRSEISLLFEERVCDKIQTACQFHQNIDNTEHCSKAIATLWCQITCEYISIDYKRKQNIEHTEIPKKEVFHGFSKNSYSIRRGHGGKPLSGRGYNHNSRKPSTFYYDDNNANNSVDINTVSKMNKCKKENKFCNTRIAMETVKNNQSHVRGTASKILHNNHTTHPGKEQCKLTPQCNDKDNVHHSDNTIYSANGVHSCDPLNIPEINIIILSQLVRGSGKPLSERGYIQNSSKSSTLRFVDNNANSSIDINTVRKKNKITNECYTRTSMETLESDEILVRGTANKVLYNIHSTNPDNVECNDAGIDNLNIPRCPSENNITELSQSTRDTGVVRGGEFRFEKIAKVTQSSSPTLPSFSFIKKIKALKGKDVRWCV